MFLFGCKRRSVASRIRRKGDICVKGSACSSHKNTESHVLKAIGLSHEYIEGAIRFSFSIFNTDEEIDYTVDVLKDKVNFLRKYKRR